jgi:quinoprotein glucose dehydrogenase
MFPLLLLTLAADLTPGNVSNLKVAWTFETNAKPPNSRAASIAAFEATPVFGGGLLYVITPFNQVIALDPGTGNQRWRFDPEIAPDRHYSEAAARGVTYADGKIFFGTLDARLIALHAASGKLVWQTRLDSDRDDGN